MATIIWIIQLESKIVSVNYTLKSFKMNSIEKINGIAEEFFGTSPEVSEIVNAVSLNLLQNRSRKQYEKSYNRSRVVGR